MAKKKETDHHCCEKMRNDLLLVPPQHQEAETPGEKPQVHLQGMWPCGSRQEASLRSSSSRLMRQRMRE